MTTTDFRTAAQELEGVPLALDPSKAQALTAGAWSGGPPRKASGSRSVAVVPIFGLISARETFATRIFGGVPLDHLRHSIRNLAASPSIGTIVLQFDSPGGTVAGVQETFDVILEARKSKHIISVADSLAASAAYYLASAAHEVVVTPSGEVGSIGVYTIHFDWSEAMAAEGVKATIVKAGDHKAEGNPYQPLGEDAQAHTQMMVNDYYDQFTRAVAKGRGIGRKFVLENFGQGRTMTAARAVKAGLADRVASIDQVLTDVRNGKTSAPRASASSPSPSARAISWSEVLAMATEADLKTLRRIAFHEAGHAVVNVEEGAGVAGMFIEVKTDGRRITTTGGSCLSQNAQRMTAAVFAAGLAAEHHTGTFIFGESGQDSNSDFDRLREAQMQEGRSIDFGSAMGAARYIIARHHYELHAIADALLERGQLSGSEVARILAGEPPGNEPPSSNSLAFGRWDQFGKAA